MTKLKRVLQRDAQAAHAKAPPGRAAPSRRLWSAPTRNGGAHRLPGPDAAAVERELVALDLAGQAMDLGSRLRVTELGRRVAAFH